MNRTNNIKLILDYLNKYSLRVKRSVDISINDIIKLRNMRIKNDIDIMIQYLIFKKTTKIKYEIYSSVDVMNMYEVDKELFYKNCNSKDYKYLIDSSMNDTNGFEFFFIKLNEGVIDTIGFIFYFHPLVDMFYENFDSSNTIIVNKFFKMFNIDSYEKFEQVITKYYDEILLA